MSSDDREIESLFSKLRREDAALAPPFDRLAARPKQALSGWPGLIRTATISAVALFALAAGWLLLTRPAPESAPNPPNMTLSQWQSPTGFLMNFSGDSVLRGQPILNLPEPPAIEPKKEEKNP